MHLPRARHEYLLREIALRGSVRSGEAATHLGVSEVTVRRDIIELDRAGRLARVHGGAIALSANRGPQAARALVGLVVPSTTAHFPDVVRGMEALAPALRVRLVLGVSHYRPEVEATQVDRLLSLGATALAVAPTTRGRTSEELAAWLRSIPVPVVLVERRIDGTTSLSELDLVRTDHAHGAVVAVEHLHGLGHRQVAVAVYDRTPTARHVRDGFTTAVERLDLVSGPDVSLSKGDDDPARLRAELESFLDDCLATGTRAAFVHTDDHAARLLEVALDRGVTVPDDFAVVAYDDENAELAAVPLTTVTPPRRELGREALRLLVDRLTEDDGDRRPPRHVELLPRLTVRESCGAVAAV
ncbi:substrate-binding domain-containing protein [Isoptericola sp. S6320L]|uniref:LacI family DNA-binding transcriptional regulator n=1 Tax=Isoptericola sp. S6320L TaxID=2926411 RepID=UPI001FF3403B|nr:LacI family DNA-binding transcriptional regulator [Isoptericola sp. S6320L]MCK0118218.1 substrate-binding domain-containing protein [Isoptericola sp. S6320L]